MSATTLIGIPFLAGGRDPAKGLDCVGLMLAAFRARGFFMEEPPIDYTRPAPAPADDGFLLWLGGMFNPIECPSEPLDVIYTARGGRHHVAILEDPFTILDTSEKVGVHRRPFRGLTRGALAYRAWVLR